MWLVDEGEPRHNKHEEGGDEDVGDKPACFPSREDCEINGAVDFLGRRGQGVGFEHLHAVP